MASVEIDSVPAGAEVVREGKALGVTPLALSLPVSGTAIELQIEHAGYRARTEKVVVRGNLVLQVPLEPVARPRPQPKPGGKDTDLMRPDDL